MIDLTGLPGRDIVEVGITDLKRDQTTVFALLVASFASRLRALGLDVPSTSFDEPDLDLYRMLREQEPTDAYARYNALRRELVSFAHALEREMGARFRRHAAV